MLKLRRIEIIGFKSFSDKGDIAVRDNGVTAIVGPNGCGKSNVSDAIAWVLGEQSAKSLRGEKMEDVIFNGTRNRSAMGMAEVTMTLTEMEPQNAYPAANGNGHANGHGSGNGNGTGNGNGNGHHPVAGQDVVIQRRLYRSGESMYLINGKPCRLRDVQDIFLGTGLGPNSYAIIEQGRVGQLLSSKPSDRRGLVEEAAGITKFKAKRKLAESRLEAARQNLSRVNDILAEVDRQRNSLKRQAGKARRFIELRTRMRQILGSLFATRAELMVARQDRVDLALGSIAGEGKRLESEIEQLNTNVHRNRDEVEAQDHELAEVRERHSEVELEHEKAVQRIERLQDQIQTLEERKATLTREKAEAFDRLARTLADKETRTQQMTELEKTRLEVHETLERMRSDLTVLTSTRNEEQTAVEQLRKQQFEIVGREARVRNEVVSRKETIARIVSQVQRLDREEAEVREQATEIERQLMAMRNEYSGQQVGFADLRRRFEESEHTLATLRKEHADAIQSATEARAREEAIRHRLQTIGELAVQRAYSTESVQRFFNHIRTTIWAPLGILADFVEVDHEYEAVIEDYLRKELQYVVVEDCNGAERALSIVKDVTKGRLECIVLGGQASSSHTPAIDGAIPLAKLVRFDERVAQFTEYLRNSYLVDSLDSAWALAEGHPACTFVARTGEVVSGRVIGWGEHEAHGPLSLKREIRDLDRRKDVAQRETVAFANDAARLEQMVREGEILRSSLASELQDMEKAILTMDHRVRSLVSDAERAEQRLNVAHVEIERYAGERRDTETSLELAEIELTETAATKSLVEQEIHSRIEKSETLRRDSENLQRSIAAQQSTLAVLEERHSSAVRELNGLRQQADDLQQLGQRAERQIREAEEQQDQTHAAIRNLDETRFDMVQERDRLVASIATCTAVLEELRRALHESETGWDAARALLDSWKDRNNDLEIEKTQVDSDLRHLASTCVAELNETIESTCLSHFEALPPEEFELRDIEYTELREKIDSMGAINMMAVDEYQEAEERFTFLTAQRQDLLDSIRDTQFAIEEIDLVCRRQFNEAFDAINSGFKEAFVQLFGGGSGELRLIEGAEEYDAGVEIVAQPPGKKLQNVLLLSGGEKALTALALLIALFRFRPSPFCVLDEVDAPLDDANVDRFAQMVRTMSEHTQFIVITHSKRTMETASTLYGVTMEEPGISKIVSVRLN